MRYQVPQFIEIEDKIFGPLTFKQFIYLAGAGGICLLFFTLLPLYFALLCMIPFIALGFALAFYKVNGRPFLVAIEHAFSYFFGHKLYLWKARKARDIGQAAVATPAAALDTVGVPKLSNSRLKDLAWSLNIKDRSTMGVVDTKPSGFEI